MEILAPRQKPEHLFVGPVLNQKTRLISDESPMFEGKNIHSSPVDGKLLCSYSEKVCMQRRLNGFAFCIRHILEDRGAPFKQCQFFAKYNKSRCINPVPILEKRNYCNSHMQVLGIIPKKLKKKREVDKCPLGNVAKEGKNNNEQHKDFDQQGTQETNSKPNHIHKNENQHSKHHHRHHKNHDSVNKKSASKAGKRNLETIMPPLRWHSYNHLLKRVFNRRKGNGHATGNVSYSSVENLKMLIQKHEEESKDLFKSYMFDNMEEDGDDCEEVSWQADSTSDYMMLLNDFSEDEVRSRLTHQTSQLRQSIKTRLEDKKLTYTFLNALVTAARTNAAATANVINSDASHKNFRNRRVSNLKHNDAIENEFERVRLELLKMISANRDASVAPSKRSKKPSEKTEKNRVKPALPKRSLKAQLQKKFAIPNKPKRKANSHVIGTAVVASGGYLPDKIERQLSAESDENHEWQIGKFKDDSTEDENMIITPRAYERIGTNASSASELAPFDMDSASLSSPSLSEDEGRHYPLVNMGRSHQDSFNFDEDDDDVLLPSSTFSMGVMSDPRDVTSPTLMQLSAESIPSTLSYPGMCSPSKASLEKSLFEPMKQGPPSPSGFSRRSLNPVFGLSAAASRGDNMLPVAASPRLIGGNLKSEGQFASSRTSLLNSDRFGVTCGTTINGSTANSAPVVNNSHGASTSVNASSAPLWAKFTLPMRNENSNTTGGFIRVAPSSSNNSIYSPPFTTPSPRSKAASSIFKFENSGISSSKAGALDTNDLVVLPRNPPPPYAAVAAAQDKATVVMSLERKYEAEPPLQKVNPDIFLSTMFTSTSTNS
eukprot:gene3249-3730_t